MEMFNMEMFNVLASGVKDACNQIPEPVFNIISLVIKGVQIVVPILLIIWGMIDFAKAVIASDEDKIKAAQKTFFKRLIAAAIVFLTVTIVQLLVGLVGTVSGTGNDSGNNIWKCINCFVDGVAKGHKCMP